ncbi:MAG TPA: D-alanine--D-alanine ligase family protein [Terriglobales bacterium]|nr:D-alanine--D-alanine ligase family protein [Terriglobales bacterium]
MAKLRVGVLLGGQSGEHEVSLVSGRAVMAALDRKKYQVTPILIGRDGRWTIGRRQAALEPMPRRRPPFDVILPILHGPRGEDGTVQGLLELAGIPYAGAGVLGAAVAMDKDVMKRLFQQAGLPIVPYLRVERAAWERAPRRVVAALERSLRYPMFVKPANLGSSVGISKVHGRAELGPALALAAQFDPKLVVEQGVEARELECAVLGNAAPEASVVGEVVAGREFYDYQAKYADAGSRTLVPAPIPARVARQARQMALAAFAAAECAGLARVDFFLENSSGRLLVNEINSMPGFTPISMFPMLWAASGLPFPALLDRIIALALERTQERRRGRA